MGKIWNDPLDSLLDVTKLRGNILGQKIEDVNSTPLRTFGDCVEQLVENILIHLNDLAFRALNIGQSCDGIRNNHTVSIGHHVDEQRNEVFSSGGRCFVDLGDAQSCSLSDIWVFVFHGLLQGFEKVVEDGFDTDAPKSPDGEASDQRVQFHLAILSERVYGEDGHIWLSFGIINDVKIRKFFQL